MKRVRLGRSGLMVSPLAIGTLTMSPLQKNLPPEHGAEILLYAAEKGVNLFDTAQYYDTYEPLRLALKQRPDLLVSTKSYAYDRAGAEAAFEEARKALDMDVIPIFLMHEQEDRLTLKGHREAFDFYLEQKAKGKILAVGFSTHRVAAVDYAPRYPGVDVVFPLINVTGVGIPDGTRDEMAEAIRIIDGRAETECSGNMTKENIATITKLGVDYVSSGALTHSAPILDLSLKHLRAL